MAIEKQIAAIMEEIKQLLERLEIVFVCAL
jgi:hypothetical protein